MLCALTEFEALCGVRPVDATSSLLDEIGADGLAGDLMATGPGPLLDGLYRGRFDPAPDRGRRARRAAARKRVWVRRLNEMYPGDASVVATLLLNYVVLQPGEAIHLTAGNLHAYLHGSGIELMGASDNVVRGGLTVKPVDVDELLRVVDPTPLAHPVMIDAAATGRYPLPEAGCTLVRLAPGRRTRLHRRRTRHRPRRRGLVRPDRRHPHPRAARPTSSSAPEILVCDKNSATRASRFLVANVE